MKTQKDIIRDLKSYHEVVLHNALVARKRYYLEESKFYRDLRFDEFLNSRSMLHTLEDILGIEESNLVIIIYG